MVLKRLPQLVGALAACLAASGCGGLAPQGAGELGQLQRLAESCPTDLGLAQYVALDLSASGRAESIADERSRVLESIVTRTAVCEGSLKVVAFSTSAAATMTAFDEQLVPEGATDIAKLRKVPDLVADVMIDISDGLAAATQSLPANGSDVTSQLGLAKEFIEQLNAGGSAYRLEAQLLTDGVQTTGVTLNTSDLTLAVAHDLGSTLPAPALPVGSVVKVSGIGKVAGLPPPTAYVDALKQFFDTYCERTGARCEVVTDYTSGE